MAHLPNHTIILYLHLFKDSAENIYVPHEALSLISQAANAPIYGFLDQYLGWGIIGGHLFSTETHGTKAAELGLRILAGEKPADMPWLEGAANVDMFDWRQLQRWGISQGRLPPGSIVRYKEPSMWEQYHEFIIGSAVLCGVEALLFIGLLVQRKRRRLVEHSLEERLASRGSWLNFPRRSSIRPQIGALISKSSMDCNTSRSFWVRIAAASWSSWSQ